MSFTHVVRSSDGLELWVSAPEGLVISIEKSTNLQDWRTYATNIAVSVTNSPVVVKPSAAIEFYRAVFTPSPGDLTPDAAEEPDDAANPTPNPEVILAAGVPAQIVPSSKFDCLLAILGPGGATLPVSGNASVIILDPVGQELTDGYSVIPSEIQFTNGVAVAHFEIRASGSASANCTLALRPSTAALNSVDGPAVRQISLNALSAILGPTPAPVTSVPLTVDFTSPGWPAQLTAWYAGSPQALFNTFRTQHGANGQAWAWPIDRGVTATFGEWRTPANHRHIHQGVDLHGSVGDDVYPARDGIVFSVGNEASGWGHYIAVDHADGTWSVYRHVNVNSGYSRGVPVTRQKAIAKIAQTTAVHLHFEIQTGPNQWLSASLGSKPGLAANPDNPATYLDVSGRIAAPIISKVVLTPTDPGSEPGYEDDEAQTQTDWRASDNLYVMAQCYVPTLSPTRSAPYSLTFQTGSYHANIHLDDFAQCEGYSPDSKARSDQEGIADYFDPDWYLSKHGKNCRYWFEWHISDYTSDPIGPRTFTLVAANKGGQRSDTYTFKFGPEITSIKGVASTSDGGQLYNVEILPWLGGNPPAWQRDKYLLEIVGSGVWQQTSNGQLQSPTALLTDFVDDTTKRVYQLKINPVLATDAAVKVRVSSQLAHNIAHEKLIPLSGVVVSTSGNNAKFFTVIYGPPPYAPVQVGVPAHSSRLVLLPEASPGDKLTMEILADWDVTDAFWGYALDLPTTWAFDGVSSDINRSVTPLSGTSATGALYHHSFSSHNYDIYSIHYIGP